MQTKKQKQEKALRYWEKELADLLAKKSPMALFPSTREDMIKREIMSLKRKGIK